jgi:hypothetical protein
LGFKMSGKTDSYFISLTMDARAESEMATLEFVTHGDNEKEVYEETVNEVKGPIFVFQVFQSPDELEIKFREFLFSNLIPSSEFEAAVNAFRMGLAQIVKEWAFPTDGGREEETQPNYQSDFGFGNNDFGSSDFGGYGNGKRF